MSKKTLIITVAALLTLVTGVIVALVVTGNRGTPADDTRPPIGTATMEPAPAPDSEREEPQVSEEPEEPAPDPEVTESGPGTEAITPPDDYVGFSVDAQEAVYEVAGKAALAWVQYDSAESDSARAERLAPWFTEGQAQIEPLLTRPEWRAKYNPHEQSRVDQFGVSGQTFIEGTAEYSANGYVVVLVDVSFTVEWGIGSGHSTACSGAIPIEIAVPYTVTGNSMAYDPTRTLEVTEPAEHRCVTG